VWASAAAGATTVRVMLSSVVERLSGLAAKKPS
jgi:hypothetical protein